MSKNQNVVTLAQVNKSLDTAEKRWFENRKPETVAKGIEKSEDLIKARKLYNEKLCEFISANLESCGLTGKEFLKLVSDTLSTKANMRMPEFLGALNSGNYRAIDSVTALSMLSAVYAGATSRKALFFAATGKGDENTSDVVRDIAMVRKLQKYLGGVGVSTESTQNSRSFGKSGFCGALNMGKMVKNEHGQNGLQVNQENPFFLSLVKMIEVASESTLELMFEGKKKAE